MNAGFAPAEDLVSQPLAKGALAKTIGGFTEAIGLDRFATYVFDYGAPVGFRFALAQSTLQSSPRLARYWHTIHHHLNLPLSKIRNQHL
jgi:hypothetical protein